MEGDSEGTFVGDGSGGSIGSLSLRNGDGSALYLRGGARWVTGGEADS